MWVCTAGGGPYTFAAAHYLSERVRGAMTISTLAPPGVHLPVHCIVAFTTFPASMPALLHAVCCAHRRASTAEMPLPQVG